MTQGDVNELVDRIKKANDLVISAAQLVNEIANNAVIELVRRISELEHDNAALRARLVG